MMTELDVVAAELLAPQPPDFHVETRTDRGVRVTLSGELDCAAVPRLAALLNDELDAGRPLVHLDLRQVTFLDCSVVGVLATVDARCRRHDSALVLVGARRPVERVLTLCGLDHLLSPCAWGATPE